MEDSRYVVYVHTNTVNGKRYVGITCQIPEYRWHSDGGGYKECPHMWNAIQKYGWDAFSHEIVMSNLTHDEACEMERNLIAEYGTTDQNRGYNISQGGDGLDPEITSSMWEDDEFKADMCKRMRDAWTDPEKRKRRSDAATMRWSDPEFKKRSIESLVKSWGKPVTCVETGNTYPTAADAARELNLCNANICRSIKTNTRCGGYHWIYADVVKA